MSSNDITIDSGDGGSSGSSETDRKIERIVEAFLADLRSGKPVEIETVLADHPDIAEPLEKRLRFFESAFKAISDAASSIALALPDPVPDGHDSQSFSLGMGKTKEAVIRLDCPHCGNRIMLIGAPQEEITCGSCGSVVPTEVDITRDDLPPEDIPTRIGRFEVRRILGQGAFGRVFLAYDPDLSRLVALKVPRYGFFASENEEQRFLREAKSIAQLSHPNIIQIYEVSHAKETPFIVCQFIEGLTLADIASSGTMRNKEIATMLLQVAEGVQYAHENGIIHRDLKPGNILVDRQRNPFVADFGLARQDDIEITVTLDGVVMGTPAYMSPEQAEGFQANIDAQSDVYSLGVILYRMLCNELPFHGTKRMLMHQVLYEEPKPPRRLNDKIPRDLETITMTAMAKERSKRYASAQDFADELRRWIRNEPIKARPVSSMTRLIRWSKRKPLIASLTAAVASLLLLGAIGSAIWAVNSNSLKKVATENANEAVEAKTKSDVRLKSMYLSNGVNSLENKELIQSALWFSKAAELETDDPVVHQIRLAMVKDQLPKLENLWTVEGTPYEVQFSASGQRVMVACEQGNLTVFDVATKKQIFSRQMLSIDSNSEQEGLLRAMAILLNDEKHVVARVSKLRSEIWNIDQNQRIATLDHAESLGTISVSPDGKLIATGDSTGEVKTWNSLDGSLLKSWSTPDNSGVEKLLFTPDSKQIVVASRARDFSKHPIHVWNFETDDLIDGMSQLAYIKQLAVSSDGKILASAADDGEIRLWKIADGTQIGQPLTNREPVSNIFFADKGAELVSVASNGDIDRWDVEQQCQITIGRRQIATATNAVMDQDQRMLATSNGDGSVRVYWRKLGTDPFCIFRNGNIVRALDFHPERPRIVSASRDGVVQIWNLASSIPNSVRLEHDEEVLVSRFSNDGQRVVSASRDDMAKIWDANSGSPLFESLSHSHDVIDIAISDNSQFVATAGADSLIKIWDVFTGKQIGEDLPDSEVVTRVRFNPASDLLISGNYNGEIKGWRFGTDQRTEPVFVANHQSDVRHITFSPDGSLFATCSVDTTARCWDAKTGLPKTSPMKHADVVNHCRFLGNDRVITCTNGVAYVWNIAATPTVAAELVHKADVVCVAVSEETGSIITADLTGTCSVWSGTSFELIRRISVPDLDLLNFAESFRFGELELVAVCGDKAGTTQSDLGNGGVQVFDISTGLAVTPLLTHMREVRRVFVSPDKTSLLSSSKDATSVIWQIPKLSENNAVGFAKQSRLLQLLSRTELTSTGELKEMTPTQTLAEFDALYSDSPSDFQGSAEEESQWDLHVKFLDSVSNDN